jgi:hypothetical protein
MNSHRKLRLRKTKEKRVLGGGKTKLDCVEGIITFKTREMESFEDFHRDLNAPRALLSREIERR